MILLNFTFPFTFDYLKKKRDIDDSVVNLRQLLT